MPDEGGARGEFELIRRLTANLPPGRGVIVGPGDDAAVVRPSDGMDLAITTDAFVEDRHFRRDWAPAGEASARLAKAIGRRLAAANLSDLAAMAAIPRWAVISVGTSGRDASWLERVERGVAESFERAGVALIGGNVGRVDGPEWYDVTLIGEIERSRAWKRSGARPGDLLAVTGSPGSAARFEQHAAKYFAGGKLSEPLRALAVTWLDPPHRIAVARALALTGGVTAAIDLSDGLHGDLAQLCEASAVGAEVDDRAASPGDELALAAMRFEPSDDYELLLAIDPEKREACAEAARGAGAPLTFIGRVAASPGELKLRRADGLIVPLPGRGYDHFDQR